MFINICCNKRNWTTKEIKNILKKIEFHCSVFRLAVLEFLNTPLNWNISSPAELLYNRKLRSLFPRSSTDLKPKLHHNIHSKLHSRQLKQKLYYEKTSRKLKPLVIRQKVKIRCAKKWESSTVKKIIDPRSYIIDMNTGIYLRRNRKHILIDSNNRKNTFLN